MNGKLSQYIKNKLSVVETEIWNLNYSDSRVVDPILTEGDYVYGIGLYLVTTDFCRNQ